MADSGISEKELRDAFEALKIISKQPPQEQAITLTKFPALAKSLIALNIKAPTIKPKKNKKKAEEDKPPTPEQKRKENDEKQFMREYATMKLEVSDAVLTALLSKGNINILNNVVPKVWFNFDFYYLTLCLLFNFTGEMWHHRYL